VKTLLIGGPKCGRVVDVPLGAVSYVTPEVRLFPTIRWVDGDPGSVSYEPPPVVVYRIERWAVFLDSRVALIPIGYCWDRPGMEALRWHVTDALLAAMALEWRIL
jgi:hypothetical protein